MIENKFRKGWYVVYTKSNYEKKVFSELRTTFKVFFPLNKVFEKKGKRMKEVEKPLFKSYLFVYLKNEKDRLEVLRANGVINYITVAGKLAMVTEKEIETIKFFIGELKDVQLASFELCIGQKIKINSGPFSGYDCFIVDYNGKEKVVVRIESLQSCIIAEINKAHIVTPTLC